MVQQTTIRIPEELHKKLKRLADEEGLTLNAYIISVLWEDVRNLQH